MREIIRDKLIDLGSENLIKRLEEKKEILMIRRIKYYARKDELRVGSKVWLPKPLNPKG